MPNRPSKSAAPLRIVHVAAPGRTGGLESVLVELSVGQRERGHDVHVVTTLDPGTEVGHPLLETLGTNRISAHTILVRSRQYLRERKALRKLLLTYEADVVHTHGFRSDVLHGRLAQHLGCIHVTTLHGFVGGSARARLYEWLQVRAAVLADVAIAVSLPIVRRLEQAGVRSVELLRNAVSPPADAMSRLEARRALGLPLNDPIIGWVGRLSPEKGPDLFIEAMKRTPNRVHGAIIGEGPMMSMLEEGVRSSDQTRRLHLLGSRANARRYLAAFDVLALTSRTEGTPMILLEAMWQGIPIVATAVGGVPDVVGNGEAILCADGDAEGIAVALARLAESEDQRHSLARKASDTVRSTFDRNTWIDRHDSIYLAAIHARASERR
jgi:glycosyltransferase involved in cell wall biosynthesis